MLIVLGTDDAAVVDVVAGEEEVLLFVELLVPAVVDVAAGEEEVPLWVDVLVAVGVEAMPV